MEDDDRYFDFEPEDGWNSMDYISDMGGRSRLMMMDVVYSSIINNEYGVINSLSSSAGNALNFGDLSKTRYYGSGTSNQTRGFAITGYSVPLNAVDSSIEYVTINSAGNAVDFGDVSMAKYLSAGCSDSHGGLGGF